MMNSFNQLKQMVATYTISPPQAPITNNITANPTITGPSISNAPNNYYQPQQTFAATPSQQTYAPTPPQQTYASTPPQQSFFAAPQEERFTATSQQKFGAAMLPTFVTNPYQDRGQFHSAQTNDRFVHHPYSQYMPMGVGFYNQMEADGVVYKCIFSETEYENCLKKFYKYNVEVLTYLARALVKGNRLREAHNALLNARPQEILKDENSTLTFVLQAIDQLKIAQKTFTWLGEHGDPHRIVLNQTLQEAQQCSDLLSQSTYHEIRARKKDEEEQIVRRKQDEERRKLREKQLQEAEERRIKEDEKRRIEREKRQEFVERTKNLLTAAESQITIEKSQRSTGGTRKTYRSKRSSSSKISHRQSESTGRYKSKATISTEEEEGEEVEDNNEGSAAAEDEQDEGNEENAEDDRQEEEEEKAPEDIDVSDDED
ncbi:unnamed protein product [Rotaria sordida]|uniref:Uncharacterized protein n=1 Tax=Rotaria sordida TaxID=392033 RepID=A0A814XR68_9BILA|nr:unnamed protein product [Rotaria sordida]